MVEMYSLYWGLPRGNSVDFRGNCRAIILLMLALKCISTREMVEGGSGRKEFLMIKASYISPHTLTSVSVTDLHSSQ